VRRAKVRVRDIGPVQLADSLKMKSEAAPKPKTARDVDDWRSGARGRPTQLFIGFLPSISKRDATSYAVGVAERNVVNLANAAYRVCPWRGGWAYEVHEGGPKRAYLPAVLRFFDEQPEDARSEDLLAHINTIGRVVLVEKTPAGLVAFVMPEDFQVAQSAWLEPGPPLSAALPSRKGVLMVGLGILLGGCVTLQMAVNSRLERPVEAAPIPIRFEELPISQWPAVLAAASTGYVDALEYTEGQWKIRRAQAREASAQP